VASFLRIAGGALVGLVLMARPAIAQVQFGDFSTNLNGSVSAGYSGDYGNQISSDHGLDVGGSGDFSGYFYNPNFISFNSTAYLNQSRANSSYQSISDASGVNFSSSIFSGSHFPGSINYSKAYNSEGNYAIPGAASFSTHGDSQTFGINWNENLPNDPSLSVGFQMGSSQYSLYGTNDEGSNAFHSFNVHSSYKLFGFGLGAFYNTGASHAQIPAVVSGEPTTETQADTSAYGFNINHLFPMGGSLAASAVRSNYSSNYLGSSTSGSVDTVNVGAGLQPSNKLHLSANANYSDNLNGQLEQSVVAAGGVVTGINSNESSNSVDLQGQAVYAPLPHTQITGYVERRMQEYMGESFGANSYGAGAVYGNFLWGGNFNVGGSIADNTVDNSNSNFLSFSAGSGYSRRVDGWVFSGSVSYSQNVQTLLITYMSSFYSYAGNVRRRFGKFLASAGASFGRTGIVGQSGNSNSNETFNASLGYSHFLTATGSYSKSSGSALLTGSGLVQTPPQPIPTSSLTDLFGGKSYSFSLSSTPIKKLTIAAAFGSANSNFVSDSITSANKNNEFNAIVQYQLRKVYLTGGYSRLEQGIGASGLPPEVISSFYIGVSRWFNFF
jgi:hypothetical protein